MSYVPNTEDDRNKMMEEIGITSFEEIINIIPEEIRLKNELNLPEPLSEYEALKLLQEISNKNVNCITHSCFLGAGAYDHYIPAIVGSVLERPEFKTAYTPYQAEVSQGTLQAMYEFQSMVCELTGMEVANASMYDGATALAEACLMSLAQNKKTEILIAGKLNPNYLKVLKTITKGKKIVFKEILADDGNCDLEVLKNSMTDDIAAVIVQQPNFYGSLQDVVEIEKICHEKKAMYIVLVDPISLGILEAPGNYGADIVVAEGQPLGIPLSFGGPYIGLFATRMEFIRKIPGRIAGITKDVDGNRGFVLTLQTREQQIKREKATSNICTNQGLMMLAATVYMTAMGKQGIKEVAEQSYHKAHFLAEEINKISGYELFNTKPFFREFLVKTPVEPSVIIDGLKNEGILAGIDTSRFENVEKGLLIAVTEKRSKDEMNHYIESLKKFSK